MDAADHKSLLAGSAAPPIMDSADALKRWDPWVRSTVAVTQLTRYMDYETVGADTYKVKFRQPTSAAAIDLVTITRPGRPFFEAQLPMVQSWAELRDERTPEILTQIDNQFAFIAAVTGLHVARKKWTMEWLMICIQFTIEVELMFKHAFGCYRPVEFSPQVQPIITTPGHGTYPMGHAAQSFATVVALAGLLKLVPAHPAYKQLVRQARRISVNRVVAGVHFPIDAWAGQALGTTLGEFFLAMCDLPGAKCYARTFSPPSTGGGSPASDYLGDSPPEPTPPGSPITTINPSPYLETYTKLAQAEWEV